jgi:hypothetical protein
MATQKIASLGPELQRPRKDKGIKSYALGGGITKDVDEKGITSYSQDLVRTAYQPAATGSASPLATMPSAGPSAAQSSGSPTMDLYRREAVSRGLDPNTFDRTAGATQAIAAPSSGIQPAQSSLGGLSGAASGRESAPSQPLSMQAIAAPAPNSLGQNSSRGSALSQGLNGPLPAGITMTKDASGRVTYSDAFALGGRIQGPGTPTSDSIPAMVRETGEGIRVSTDERILSKEQDAFLSAMAKHAGFDSLDAMLEDGTGKPVGPTIKTGKRAAATGMAPEDDPFAYRRDPALRPAPAPAAPYRPDYSDQNPLAALPKGPSAADQGTSPLGRASALGQQAIAAMPTPTSVAPALTDTLTPGKTGDAAVASYVNNPGLMDKFNQQHAGSGITAGLDANGRPVFSGTGTPGAGGPERSPMDIYRSEAAIRGLDQNTFDRPDSGPKVASIGNSNLSDAGWKSDRGSKIDMPGGLSARQQANFLSQQQQIQAQMRGQDLNHAAAMAGQEIAARGQDLTAQTSMRGQLMTSKAEADRFAGNPLDNALKREKLTATQRIADMQSRYLNESDPEKRDALGHQLRTLSGRASAYDGGPTLAQDRSNAEIDAARDRVAGMTPDDIKRKTQQFSATGRENPDFDPTLAKAVGLAGRRKIGADDVFDARQQGPQGQPQARASFTGADVNAAIRAGADPSKVAERIRSMGGNPGDYGL